MGLPVTGKLMRAAYIGSDPRAFTDSEGAWYFNRLTARYLDRYMADIKAKRYREITLSEYDIKVLAINYSIIEKTNLRILKYLPNMSYQSMREMNACLYALIARKETYFRL